MHFEIVTFFVRNCYMKDGFVFVKFAKRIQLNYKTEQIQFESNRTTQKIEMKFAKMILD